ncbi:hypothetical protein FRB94_013247 [Tulasnella sp. JGI-2019a]|nr:hypothetical protein FRB94_013247 [Tulasnella sp. JGI-2019a]
MASSRTGEWECTNCKHVITKKEGGPFTFYFFPSKGIDQKHRDCPIFQTQYKKFVEGFKDLFSYRPRPDDYLINPPTNLLSAAQLVKLIQLELSEKTQVPVVSGSQPRISLSTAPTQTAVSISASAGPSHTASIKQEGTSSPFAEYREPKEEEEEEESDHPQSNNPDNPDDSGDSDTDSSMSPSYKFPPPESFNGKPDAQGGSKAREFFVKCEIYFSFYNDQFKVDINRARFILFLCKDAAYTWASAYMAALGDSSHELHAILNSASKFKDAFLAQFSSINLVESATQELSRLNQSGKISEFTASFKDLASQTKWNDESKIAMFYTKLSDRIKDVIVASPVVPTKYKELERDLKADNQIALGASPIIGPITVEGLILPTAEDSHLLIRTIREIISLWKILKGIKEKIDALSVVRLAIIATTLSFIQEPKVETEQQILEDLQQYIHRQAMLHIEQMKQKNREKPSN